MSWPFMSHLADLVALDGGLQLDDYDIDKNALGVGSAAAVYYGRRRRDNNGPDNQPREVVLKILTPNASAEAENDLSLLRKEVSILSCIAGHPNIVGFYGVCLMDQMKPCRRTSLPSWAMQLEYCSGGDLYSAVARQRYPEADARSVMMEVLQGLVHMHVSGIVHRDVKPENVLLSRKCNGIAKLTDFGISARLCDSVAMKKRCGSPGYVAPEVCQRREYGIKVDSFSSGALLYFLISGKQAFSAKTVEMVMCHTVERPVNFRRSVCLERLSGGCKAFIKCLLEKNPDERPTANEALSMMTWLTDSGSEEEDLDTRQARLSVRATEPDACRTTDNSDISGRWSLAPSGRNTVHRGGSEDSRLTGASRYASSEGDIRYRSEDFRLTCTERYGLYVSEDSRHTSAARYGNSEDQPTCGPRYGSSEDSRLTCAQRYGSSEDTGPTLLTDDEDLNDVLSEFQPTKPRKAKPAHRSPAVRRQQVKSMDVFEGPLSEEQEASPLSCRSADALEAAVTEETSAVRDGDSFAKAISLRDTGEATAGTEQELRIAIWQ